MYNIRSKCPICDAIYIGNTQQTFKNKNGWSFLLSPTYTQEQKKTDQFAAHFKQHFNTTTSRTDMSNYMTLKVVK